MYGIWSAPLIVGETIYVPNEEGNVSIFRLAADPQRAMKPGSGWSFARGKRLNLSPIIEIELDHFSRTSPVYANSTLFIATNHTLYAIATEKTEKRANADAEPPIKENTHATSAPAQKQFEPNGTRVPKSAFVPTPQGVVDRLLDLAHVGSHDRVFDLGSGDGRIVITAAKKYGAIGIGYEIDKTLVTQSKINAVAAGVADRVTIHQSDLFNADLSRVDVLTLYLYPIQNRRLLPRLAKLKHGVRIVTHRYGLPGVKPQTTLRIKSSESRETHTIYLYTTPLDDIADSP